MLLNIIIGLILPWINGIFWRSSKTNLTLYQSN